MKENKLKLYVVPVKRYLPDREFDLDVQLYISAYNKKEAIKLAIQWCNYKTNHYYYCKEYDMLKDTKHKLKSAKYERYFTEEYYKKQLQLIEDLKEEYERRFNQ